MSGMSLPELMRTAADAASEVVRGVQPSQLSLPTPCAEWDVRTLINHLFTWSAHGSELVARKLPLDEAALAATDYVTDDWAKAYAEQLDKTVAAWAAPGATEGMAAMGSGPFPAAELAKMFLGELVLHGWDLARATGQELRVDDEVAEAALDISGQLAGQARELGLFGEPVATDAAASTFDRVLAVTGRDPGWHAG